jgi:Flp pilus assembly protein TadB
MGRRSRRPGAQREPEPQKRPRERMGAETPGAVLKGPAITVTCECGERHELFYGERWTCPRCGRSYDSNRIPAEQYAAIRRLQLRFRALPIAIGLMVLALAVVFTLTGNVMGVFFLLPVALIVWFVFLRPTHRRRYRAAIAELPRWELRAE